MPNSNVVLSMSCGPPSPCPEYILSELRRVYQCTAITLGFRFTGVMEHRGEGCAFGDGLHMFCHWCVLFL